MQTIDNRKKNATVLWYQKPAQNWNEALPIGNGRIGGMVFGGIRSEQILFGMAGRCSEIIPARKKSFPRFKR